MEILLIIISAIFVNNIVLAQFLGICPYLGVSNKYLLVVFGLEFLQTIAFILVIAALVQMVEIVLKKISPVLYQALGIFLPLITTNCAVLGVAITVTKEVTFGGVTKMLGLGEALIYAFATSLGYGLAMILFAGLREHLALNDVPKAFKGIPIALITVGILAMAFMGFAGIA